MTHFTLDALSARKGDALVLRWGADGKSHMALVDGGPSGVWTDVIHPHLAVLTGTDRAGNQNPVGLELVVVSHVDDDHIHGIIDLAIAVDTAHAQAARVPVTISEVWHNGFADLQFLADFKGEPDLQLAIKDASANPGLLHDASATRKEDPTVGDITAGAQSVAQGRQLDQVIARLRVPKNTSFADRQGYVRAGGAVTVDGLRVSVLAPNTQLLDQLKKEWQKQLKDILAKEVDSRQARVSALAAAVDDPSVPNQSSIVLLVTFAGKTMLLTGDARGDHLIDAITKSNVAAVPLHVDLFKIPHHGSARSNDRKLFEAITADHYVISGNGEHGNPHPDTLQSLFESQAGRHITVHLTNRPAAGAVKPADVAKAVKAQAVLDLAQADRFVTICYRDPEERAITIDLV